MPRTSRSLTSPRGVLGGPGLGTSGEGVQRFSLSMGPQEGTTALYRLEEEKERARGGDIRELAGAGGAAGRARPLLLLPACSWPGEGAAGGGKGLGQPPGSKERRGHRHCSVGIWKAKAVPG